MRRIHPESTGLLIMLLAWMVLGFAGAASARTETFEWTQASPERVAGFEVLIGNASGNYQQVQDVGLATRVGGQFSVDLNVPDAETVYVVVRAVGLDGQRSANSNERVRLAPSGGSGGSGSGGSGSGGSGSGGSGGPGGGDPVGGGSFPILQPVAGETWPHRRALMSEDFESVGLGTAVPGWVDTAGAMSLVENDALFGVAEESTNRVLTTSSVATDIHSHYVGSGSDSWHDYMFTGAMGIGTASGGVGVTAYSQFDSNAAYYRLRRFGSRAFELVMHPGVSCSDPSTDVIPSPDRWYRFRIRVDQVSQGTRVRARVWRSDQSEPSNWQAQCVDTSGAALREGTVGVWSMGQGSKFWDEFQVVPLVLDDEEVPPGLVDPEILSPGAGSVLPGSSATFSWQQNDGLVTGWWLYIGTTPGGSELLDSGAIGEEQTSLNVSDLPTDGSTLYVRLHYRRGASPWEFVDSTVQAATVQVSAPALVMPAAGGTLGTNGVFQWSAPSGIADQFWLYVGSTLGGAEYRDTGALATSSVAVPGLPVDGRMLYVRLWYRKGAESWSYSDAMIQAATLADPAIQSPAAGSTIAAGQTFQWNNPSSAYDQWWLYLGSTPGGDDLLDTGLLTHRSYQVGTLAGGGTVYARLWYRSGSAKWSYVDSSYQAVGPGFTAPTADAPIQTETYRFRWSNGGTDASDWWLWLGTTPGKKDLVDSGNLGNQTNLQVSGLPLLGARIYARLWFRTGGETGAYSYVDRVFQTAVPTLVSPAPGETLPGSTATFTWNGSGVPVADWWLYLGTRAGESDLLDSGNLGSATSLTVDGLPSNGRAVHVRLWFRTDSGSEWRWRDYQVVAAP